MIIDATDGTGWDMKNTKTGKDLAEEAANREVAKSNIDSVRHAPKDLSKLNLRVWFHIESLLRHTKAEIEKRNRDH